jgi:signal peptidase I
MSTMIPGLGQIVLGHGGVAASLIAATAVWIFLFFRPFRLESTNYGWLFLIFGGWLLTIAACCHALRSRRGGKAAGSFMWLLVLLPLTVIFPLVSQAIALRAAGFRVFRIDVSSMEPVLLPGDSFMADMDFFRTHPIARGEIVLLRSPVTRGVTIVKRVIAIGGDTISGKDAQIFVNGKVLDEPYVEHTGHPAEETANFGPVVIPAHQLFVMGDNRDVSLDSRTRYFGLVDDSSIVGKPLYIIGERHKRLGEQLP